MVRRVADPVAHHFVQLCVLLPAGGQGAFAHQPADVILDKQVDVLPYRGLIHVAAGVLFVELLDLPVELGGIRLVVQNGGAVVEGNLLLVAQLVPKLLDLLSAALQVQDPLGHLVGDHVDADVDTGLPSPPKGVVQVAPGAAELDVAFQLAHIPLGIVEEQPPDDLPGDL